MPSSNQFYDDVPLGCPENGKLDIKKREMAPNTQSVACTAAYLGQVNTSTSSTLMMSNLCDLTFSTHCSSNVHSKSNCIGLGEVPSLVPIIGKFSSSEAVVIDKENGAKRVQELDEYEG